MRHEVKYIISPIDEMIIKQRVECILGRDKHDDGRGYVVTSLYFDTPDNEALTGKLNGVSNREKYRIRYYNYDLNNISIEKKIKRNNLYHKDRSNIEKDILREILSRKEYRYIESDNNLLSELCSKLHTLELEPKIIVEYNREAFTYEYNNVRITFDTNIKASYNIEDFILGRSGTAGLHRDNNVVMEIKWEGKLPEHIRALIGQLPTREVATSKYAEGRYITGELLVCQ